RSQSGHKTRLSGSRLTAVSVQLGSTGGRSCKTMHRRSQPAQRRRRYTVVGMPSRQGRQGSQRCRRGGCLVEPGGTPVFAPGHKKYLLKKTLTDQGTFG